MNDLYTQENLERLLQECYDEIEKALKDTIYLSCFDFKKDNIRIQAKETSGRILGNCHYDSVSYDYDYWGRKLVKSINRATITIFKHLNRDTKGIKETIIHELIHTLKGCQNHKAEFKRHCNIIKQYLGYSCYSGQHEDVKSIDYLNNYKHFLICKCCHKIVGKGTRFTIPYKKPETRICCTCRNGNLEYKNLTQIKECIKLGEIKI